MIGCVCNDEVVIVTGAANTAGTKQPLLLTKPMGKLFMEAVPVLQVVQPVITLLH